jgi:hypothetical protein
MAADTVIGVFERDQLPAALAAVHRAGYGPNARVLQSERGDLSGQLRRAGIVDPPTLAASDLLLLVLFAPSRVSNAADLLQRTGARAVHVATRGVNGTPYAPSGWTPPQQRPRKPRIEKPDESAPEETV